MDHCARNLLLMLQARAAVGGFCQARGSRMASYLSPRILGARVSELSAGFSSRVGGVSRGRLGFFKLRAACRRRSASMCWKIGADCSGCGVSVMPHGPALSRCMVMRVAVVTKRSGERDRGSPAYRDSGCRCTYHRGIGDDAGILLCRLCTDLYYDPVDA